MILSIDGAEYDVKCSVRRQADVRDTDISGEMLDGSYFHDVEGTYYDYDISFTYPLYDQYKYAAIIEALTEPVDGHTFVLPYNDGTVTVTAKVESVSDDLLELVDGTTYWRQTSFRLSANHPTRQPTLEETITRGRAALPDIDEPEVGDTYTWNGTAWVAVDD